MEGIARRTRSRVNVRGVTESVSRARGGDDDGKCSSGGGGAKARVSGGGAKARVSGAYSRLGLPTDGVAAATSSLDLIINEDDEERGGGESEKEDPSEKYVGLRSSVSGDTISRSRCGLSKGDSVTPASFDQGVFIVESNSECHVQSESGPMEELGCQDDWEPVGELAAAERNVQEVAACANHRISKPGEGLSCIARRTRSQVRKHNSYFKEVESDDSEEKEREQEKDVEEDEEPCQENNIVVADNSETTCRIGDACIEKGKILGGDSLKKKKFGIDILVSVSKENTDSEGHINCVNTWVAQRTRSHFNYIPNKKKKLGTVSNPYQLDLYSLETEYDLDLSSSGGEDEDDTSGFNGDGMDIDGREEGVSHEGLQQGRSSKRKRVQALKADNLFKLLVDTILNDPEKLPEGLVPLKGKSPRRDASPSCNKELVPLVFSFGDEDAKPVEKSEYKRGLEELWGDFDFAMELKNIGIYHNCEGQTEEVNVPEVEADPSTLCPKTEKGHQFILDEQIGIRCKFCSYVKQDVKDILPSWATRFSEKSARKNTADEEGHLIFDGLSAKANNCANQGTPGLLNGTVWNLIPGIHKTMYLHQREAFEFMWQNLAGGIQLDKLKSYANSDDVGGCVISHAPGTGKTRLAIVFIQTYMKVFPKCRPVIVAPCGMLLTWKKEFKKWGINLPLHLLNLHEYSGKEDDAVCELVQKEPRRRKWIRIVKLYSWAKGNSILGLSYGLFKRLTDERVQNDLGCAEIRKILLEKPGLIVLDEGHTPRNDHTLIWKALEKVKTEQRIILSGTPFQNNFGELYNTLCLVRPQFAEKILPKAFKLCQRRAEFLSDNVQQHIFLDRNEGKGERTPHTSHVNGDSLEELRSIIKPFVHVYNGKILENLPGLRDCLIILDPLPQQKYIIDTIDDIRSSSPFENEYKISLASIHPSLMTSVALSEREKSLIDVHLLEKLRLNPDKGAKTRFVMELVRLSAALKEKVVVFSQYLHPLSLIRDQLLEQFNWMEGKEVLQMNGKIPSKHRQSSIDVFNSQTSEARVLLASTKACCEGITLTGASRVVLLDILWNPSVERQAISRAYRIGQEKVVYTYRLITSGTSEGDKYETQAKKNHLSKIMFSPELVDFNNIKNNSSQAKEERSSMVVYEDKILKEMTGHDKLKDIFKKIYYPPEESNFM